MKYWQKHGQIFDLEPINNYLVSHASNPLAVHLNDDIYRVFFSARNAENKSSVGFVDIDIIRKVIISSCNKESFTFSSDGFYSHGVSIGNLYKVGQHRYVLFMGWKVSGNSHWRGEIGRLRLRRDNETFSLVGDMPLLSVDKEDLISLSYPWVMFDDHLYKMWYGSTISWDSPNGEMVHVIKFATSEDGENWKKHGVALPYELGVAQAFSRPTVIKDSDGYHMWFSFRSGTGKKYRIGYAHSLDGYIWDRKERSGIDVSEQGWDSEMICYPYVFDHKGKRYMLYNGNEYGKTGFGLAVLESE